MKKNKLLNIYMYHFSPLEWYPPIMNILNVLDKSIPEHVRIKVFTTGLNLGQSTYSPKIKSINIIRLGGFKTGQKAINRYVNYFIFYFTAFLYSLIFRPQKVFYFETLSAIPAIALTFFFKKIDVFAHYHEYMTPDEYKKTMLNRVIYKLEHIYMYPIAKWISHTNRDRLNMFLSDVKVPFDASRHFILPNYPPQHWLEKIPKKHFSNPVRLVYVGSFGSLDSLYIKELLQWVISYNGKVSLDVYSFNVTDIVHAYVNSLNCPHIQLNGFIDYSNLNNVLRNFDIGLIIYKGIEKNVIFSEPNKLFEYLTCGLDVWYPEEMIGCRPYNSDEYWPKILALDFNNLAQYELNNLIERKEGFSRPINYTCEVATQTLLKKLLPECPQA